MEKKKKLSKKFPIDLELSFNKKLDLAVLQSDVETKHQYIINAIKEKMERESK